MYRVATAAPVPRLAWGRPAAAPVALRGLSDNPGEVFGYWSGAPYARPRLVGLGVADPATEFIAPTLNADHTLASCPTGYKILDADPDQNGAVLVLGTPGGATDHYARCIRADIFADPGKSVSEPVLPPGYTPVAAEKSWGQWLRDTFGLGATPWVIGGVVVILGGFVAWRVLR